MEIYHIQENGLVIDGQFFVTLPAQKEALISILNDIKVAISQVKFDFDNKIIPTRKIGWVVKPVGEDRFQLVSNRGEIVLEWPSSNSGSELKMKIDSILTKAASWERP